MNRILVVCEGNICRSPMAEALLARALPECRVHSAGLNALSGMPADDTALRLMQARGIDIASHRAIQLTSDLCKHTDLILVMTAEQRKRIEQKHPFACGRVFRLGEFMKQDVPDPYRRPERAFVEALEIIQRGVDDWLLRMHQF